MVDVRQPSGTLHSEQRDLAVTNYNGSPVARRADLPILVADPWLLTEHDIPWLYDICTRRYSRKYDPISTEGWFRNIVLKNPMMFCPQRTPNAFCISMLSVLPWLPSDFECNVAFICAEENGGWEAMKLLRASIKWAESRKCKTWKMSSDTAVDLSALAKRLGANEMWPRYVIHFKLDDTEHLEFP